MGLAEPPRSPRRCPPLDEASNQPPNGCMIKTIDAKPTTGERLTPLRLAACRALPVAGETQKCREALRNSSIRVELLLWMALNGSFALLLAGVGFIIYDAFQYRNT